ncbi:MAG: DEAD/DEAH box helicase [Gemmatimonadota bacterium]|nr:DEAD/DEAH box helicase [Gemmatimonadota bacterium]
MSNRPGPTADLFAPFRALKPAARIVAMAYGTIYPCRRTPLQMSQFLKQAGFKLDGRPVPQYRYKVSCDEVVAAGIVHKTTDRGKLVADPMWAARLTIEAFRQHKLPIIERAFRTERQDRWHAEAHLFAAMEKRCHVVAGRIQRLDQDFDEIDPEEWWWLGTPGAGGLLAKLPARYLNDALHGCVDYLTQTTAADPEPLLAAWHERMADAPGGADDVAFIRLLQGRRDDAIAVFDALPGELPLTKAARTGRAATHALAATLQGDDAAALRYIEDAIASEKAGTRKRNVFPVSRAFTLALLTLVRDHGPDHKARLEHLLRVAQKTDADPRLLHFVSLAVHIRAGGSISWAQDCGTPSLTRLIEGWTACWEDDFSHFHGDSPHGDDRFHGLSAFTTLASLNGYRWIAAECLEVVARVAKATDREVDWVTLDGVPATPAETASALHRDLGTTTLASLISPVAEWEYALQEIEQFAHETRQKTSRSTRTAAAPKLRLAWVLGVDRFGEISLAPKEQRTLKSGKWSKGRAVALKRLQAQAGTMDFLIAQDRAAAAQIQQSTYRWHSQPPYYLPPGGIHALAGHPYVFNEAGDPVEIVRRDPELVLSEHSGVMRAKVEPHVDDSYLKHYLIVLATDVRCEVTRFTRSHRKLCEVVPAGGLELPMEARDRLVDAVSALAGEIRIQGALEDTAHAATRVDSDPRPWVRLEPHGPGLTAAVVVEPVPDSGTHFPPGIGGTTVFATLNGDNVQATRDLATEAMEFEELLRSCPMLAGIDPDGSLAYLEPHDCLELVDQLDAAGARCLWPQGQPFRIVARADAASLRVSVKAAADWFRASGELDIDGQRTLGLLRLFELMDRNPASRFVPLEDGAFVSLTTAFQRQLADLRSLSAPSGKKQLRLHRTAAAALPDFFDDMQLTTDAGWRAHRKAIREAVGFEPQTPGTLQAELRPYQEDGFRWLSRLSRWGAGACLADDMGLGKTVQALALLLARAGEGPALVVAPTSVVANWLDEARRFAPTLRTRPYTGLAGTRARQLEDLGPLDVVVTTYGLLHIDIDTLSATEWSTVVLDEAQAIKNPATKRARAARKLKAGFRVVTTGTPIQNNLMDLYSLFAFINPGMLGSMKRFRENLAFPIERDGDPVARTRLRRLISPFVLRRVKAEVLDDLPPRTEVTLKVEMSPEETAFYEAVRRRAVDDLEALAHGGSDAGGNRLQVLAHLTRLRLASCNPRLVRPEGPPSSKLKAFAAMLDELRESRHKVLVFSQFVRHLKLVEKHLLEAGVPYQYLDGSTPAKKRAERVAAFQSGDGDAFLISLRAGGTGLNLTAADYVIHMDPWWNPAAEDQASDRAHRIGQTRPVTIYRLVTRGTIEEQIVELHRHKRELADRLLEGADAPARLSTEELLALLRG